MSSENVRFSRLLTHPSLLRTAKGDVEDIETSLLSQVVAEQQLGILEAEEAIKQELKVKRKEMKWEPQREGVTDKEARLTAGEEIHLQRQKEVGRKQEGDKISESKDEETVELQVNSSDVTATAKQNSNGHHGHPPTSVPTVLFKQLKEQYQSISDKLKEHEERELVRRATLESRKKDAAQLRQAKWSQKKAEQDTAGEPNHHEEEETSKEIVIQLDQTGSYSPFDNDRHNNITITTHKRHTQPIRSSVEPSVGDDEYYQQMTNDDNTDVASKAT